MLAALIIAFLIAVSASFICSLCESSFLSLGKTQLAGLMESGNPAGKVLERMKAHPSRPLAAILTVNTIANMMGAAQVGAQASGRCQAKYGLGVVGSHQADTDHGPRK